MYITAIFLLTTVAVMGAANDVLWFDGGGGSHAPRFNVRQSLVLDLLNNVFNVYDLDGSVTQYDATTGAFIRHSDVSGGTVAVVSRLDNGFNFTEVQRTVTVAGVALVESFLYRYVDSTLMYPLISSVTLWCNINGGPWSFVDTALYT